MRLRIPRRLRLLRLRTVVLITAIPGLLLPFFFFRSLAEFGAVALKFPGEVQRVMRQRDAVWDAFRYKLGEVPRILGYNSHEEKVPTEHLWANDEIHLHVPGAVWDELLQDLPASGEQYRKIQVWNGGRYGKAKLRIRGNSGFHWLFGKRSLKVKTSKKHLLRGFRHINLSVKYPYVESLTHEVAREWGLLTPISWPVQVFTDGKLYGTLRFIEDVDESFLRRHGRMPGDIYKGEGSPFTNEWHHGTPVNFLLRDPYVWPLLARDNSLPGTYRSEMVDMARAAGQPGTGGIRRLNSLFRRDTVVRHIAYHLFLNELHAVDGNNLKLYLDPLTGRLEPIVWDPYIGSNRRIFSNDPDPHYPVLSSVFHKLGSDPRLMQRVFAFLEDRLRHPEGLLGRIGRLREDLKRHRESFKIERPNPWFPITEWFFEANVNILRDNRSRILGLIGRTSLQAMIRENAAILGCRGVAGIRLEALELRLPPGTAPRLVEDRNRNLRADPGEPVLKGHLEPAGEGNQRFVLDEPLLILPAYVGINRVDTVPLAYPILLPPGAEPTNATAINAITGKPVAINLVGSWPAPCDDVIHPWDLPPEPEPVLRKAPHPVFRVEGLLRVPSNETLVIRPGTTVLLGPGATIQSFGRILARGTAGHPIVFQPVDGKTPWGCLALQGHGASGSIFRHVVFRRGSQARFGALHYSGMVNVHRAEDVLFDHCEISDNVLGDDALHTADAEVRLEECFFHDTNSDALDMDYSRGRVAGCRFERVGNDAIDLMTSSPVLTANTMLHCGDKGVSVGERSSPLIYDTRMTDCDVGVQIKDGSDPLILNCSITGCRAGVDAYRKNWRYGTGGRGRLVNSIVEKNDTDLSIRKESRLIVRSSVIGVLPRDRSRLELHHVAASGDPMPAPDVAGPAQLVRPGGLATIGLTGDGGRTTLRPLLADDRFIDGFVLDTRGWRLEGDVKIHVKETRLTARLRTPQAALVRDYGLSGLPPDSRLHLRISATRPAAVTLRLEGDFGTVEKVLDLARQETAAVIGIPGRTLQRVSFHAASRTTLRLRWAAISVP
ncbi:MAG: hypothetical protein GXP47_04455 [Acidobacteria bacterium]|nr:hypothetical protein [Acidobacteriota bacterium]